MGRPHSILKVIPEAVALDAPNDIRALAGEGLKHLERSYRARLAEDWMTYLNETQDVVSVFHLIKQRARTWAAEAEAAPLAA